MGFSKKGTVGVLVARSPRTGGGGGRGVTLILSKQWCVLRYNQLKPRELIAEVMDKSDQRLTIWLHTLVIKQTNATGTCASCCNVLPLLKVIF